MKQLKHLYSTPEKLKTFMQKNGLDGPILVQLFSCDKFDARRISHEIQSTNKHTTVSVLISKSFACSELHFTILPEEADVVAQVQPLEFDFFHSRPVVLFTHSIKDGVWEMTSATQSVSQWGYDVDFFMRTAHAPENIIHPDDLGRVIKAFEQSVISGENAINLQYRIYKKDGSIAWISNHTQIIRNSKNELAEVLCYWLDISQDKENEVVYTEIINTTTEGFWLLDSDFKIVDVNYSLCAMLGYKKDEMLGRKPHSFVESQDHSVCDEQERLVCDISSHSYELNLRTKEGRAVCVLANATTIYDQLGDVKSFAFFTDISRQKQIEADLIKRKEEVKALNNALESRISLEVQKNREKDQMMHQQSRLASMGEMIGNIAHQWRQPLNIMALIMQDLYISNQLNNLDSQKVEESYEKANNILQYMSQTIDDFRNFFKQDNEYCEFSVKEAVDTVYSLVSTNFAYHHVACKIDVKHDSIINGGQNEFKQVLINILNNAQEAMISNESKKKEIRILVTRKGNQARIVISDTGGGMAKDVINKIFDPYFTTKGQTQGTGLGLFMSKQIVENTMLGSLSAKNIKDGAEFTIALPIKKQLTIDWE